MIPALTVSELLDRLLEVAYDLRWTWHDDAQALFRALDPEWEQSPNPVRLLRRAPGAQLRQALTDPDLAALAERVVADFDRYRSFGETWFAERHGALVGTRVAFVAAEFGFADCLPIFAGGLGAVSAEMLKSASALGVPAVGIGLLYREHSHQWLDAEGRQQESWEYLHFDDLPVRATRRSSGELVEVSVPLPGRTVRARVWQVTVGRSVVFLLDTDVASNSRADRAITRRLYGGDDETRIQQELVLGVGGLRALATLGVRADALHLNEGHAAFAAVELLADAMDRDGLTFEESRAALAPAVLFTTHTPVPAGHDFFPQDLVARYLAPLAEERSLPLDTLLHLGRERPDDPSSPFCTAALALQLAGHRNGVSRLHGSVAREMWAGLWPRVPASEVPIGSVTNGIHVQTWASPEMRAVFDREFGSRWRATPGDALMWERVRLADDEELWAARNAARARLVAAARASLRTQLERRGADAATVDTTSTVLSDDALTLGFVGRFVAYKRPTLLLRDPERLVRLLADPTRPIQCIFGGKAHPRDEHGKELLRTLMDFAYEAGVAHRLVFVEDFDFAIDTHLSQGADVWLNTPRRPLEACGIGGMKCGINGGLNVSTLDGWWDEAWNLARAGDVTVGWAIGRREPYDDPDQQDEEDAASLYEMLERQIVPAFYERDGDDVPRRWLGHVRQSLGLLAPTWSSHRMVQDYVEQYYVPALVARERLVAHGGVRGRMLAEWTASVRDRWSAVRVTLTGMDREPLGGTAVRIVAEAEVALAGIHHDDVAVEAWIDPDGAGAPGFAPRAVRMAPTREMHDGTVRFTLDVTLDGAGPRPIVAARVRPQHPDLPDGLVRGCMTWTEGR